MSYESMSLIEGKVKLPFLRGEHSPAMQHFRDMEESMARSLTNWLCNGYIEVRHMSLSELGPDEAMLKVSALGCRLCATSLVCFPVHRLRPRLLQQNHRRGCAYRPLVLASESPALSFCRTAFSQPQRSLGRRREQCATRGQPEAGSACRQRHVSTQAIGCS